MSTHRNMRLRVALGAWALAFAGTVAAQAQTQTSTAESTPSTSTPGTLALPTSPANVNAATPAGQLATQPMNASAELIGSSNVSRLDNPSMAFDKLARGRMFLQPSDTAQLPGFGDAFAHADRDHDGRLDRTQFVDAWDAYLQQVSGAATTTTRTTTTTTTVASGSAQ